MRLRRLSRSVFRKTLRSIRGLSVEREEDVLEIRLVAVEPEDVMGGERLDEPVGFAMEGAKRIVEPCRSSSRTPAFLERVRGGRVGERHLDPVMPARGAARRYR